MKKDSRFLIFFLAAIWISTPMPAKATSNAGHYAGGVAIGTSYAGADLATSSATIGFVCPLLFTQIMLDNN